MIHDFLWEGRKIHPPRHLVQLPIWSGGLGVLDIDTQLNALRIKWIRRLFSYDDAVWKDLMLYRLNLNLKSNQGLALFCGRLDIAIYKRTTMKTFLYKCLMPG